MHLAVRGGPNVFREADMLQLITPGKVSAAQWERLGPKDPQQRQRQRQGKRPLPACISKLFRSPSSSQPPFA